MRSMQSKARAVAVGAAATMTALGGVAAWRRAAPARAVRRAFAAWASGTGSIYDLMENEAEIVIPGTTAHCGVYRKDAFLCEVAQPFVARFTTPPLPRPRGLWAKGPSVLVRAEARGKATDGQAYTNDYVFVFDFEGCRVTRVTEFLDMGAFEAVWDRVVPTVHHAR